MSEEIVEVETEDEVNYVDVEVDLPEYVIDYYEELAKTEDMSFNDIINVVLQKFLDNEEAITKIMAEKFNYDKKE